MKGPSLQKTAALSAVLHITALLLSLLVLRQTNRMTMPSPYIVNLVSGGGEVHQTVDTGAQELPPDTRPVVNEKKASDINTRNIQKEEKIDQRQVEDSIAAIMAKKRVAKLKNLRDMISITRNEKPMTRQAPTGRRSGKAGTSQGNGDAKSYNDKVGDEIHRQWYSPQWEREKLETIVSIKIRRDGTISRQDIVIEKKSGSRLFDRLAVEAIAKASPVSPPPQEMEIGIRFSTIQ